MNEKQVDTVSEAKQKFTFSRRRHCALSSDATDIFIPDNSDIYRQGGSGYIKQFAMHIMNGNGGDEFIVAPAEFNKDESERSNPFSAIAFNGTGWLEDNGFMTREVEYEDIFKNY